MPVLCQMEREGMIERVDFFARQVKRRVWDSFNDFDKQAQAHGEKVYEKLGSATGSEHLDEADIAEIAFDESIKFSELLFELERHMTLASVAALYHQWEKDLKRFLGRELRLNGENPDWVWTAKTTEIHEWLEERGWPLRSHTWFPILDACRLIVNVHKHGKGRSLEELKEKYPQYFDPLEGEHSDNRERDLTYLDHRTLHITEENFDQFVEAVRQFWGTFPGQIYLEEP